MDDVLVRIEGNRAERRRVHAAVLALDEELAELIRAAFDLGLGGPMIAAAAGLSKERVYQIRNGRR